MVLKLLSNIDDIGEKMASIAQKLIPDWVSFVIQFSSVIILLLVVFFFAYKPIKKMLKKICTKLCFQKRKNTLVIICFMVYTQFDGIGDSFTNYVLCSKIYEIVVPYPVRTVLDKCS